MKRKIITLFLFGISLLGFASFAKACDEQKINSAQVKELPTAEVEGASSAGKKVKTQKSLGSDSAEKGSSSSQQR